MPGARPALVLLLGINLFNYIDRYILAAVAIPIQNEFGISKTRMGSLVTAFLITYMVVSPVFGWLADRMSRWIIVGSGVIVWSLASGGSGLAWSFASLAVMRCLIGVGEAAYGPVAPTLISDLYPISVRGKVLAWFYAAIPVGSALGFVIGGFFANQHWHWAFFLTVPPGILLGLICFFMREPARGLSESATAPPAARTRATMRDYLQLLKNRSYVLNTIAMTLMTFAIGGVAFWMPSYLIQERGLGEKAANSGFGAMVVVAGLLATLSGGWAGDALRKRFGGSYFLVSAGGMLLGFPMLLLLLVTPFPWCWGVMFLTVFALFFNTGPSNTALANVTPASIRATAFAVNIFIIHALGDALSPAVIGYIADRASLGVAFASLGGTIFLGGGVWLWGSRYLAEDTRRASGEM